MLSPKRSTKRGIRNLPAKVVVSENRSFSSREKWDLLLSSDLKLSEKFESVKRTIYGIGFTCVVIMGVVKLTGEEVALKVIMKSKLHTEEELKRARFELAIHCSLQYEYILPFIASEETSESLILVTPLAYGDLHSLTAHKVLSEENCRNLVTQLLLGLDYLHNTAKVMHCDIKPANILVFKVGSEFVVKLCDFGFAESVSPGVLLPYNGLRGSLGYFSPEQLTHLPYGTGVDMYALGIIVYSLLCGYEPFYPSNTCIKGTLKFESPYWNTVSIEAKNFVQSLLQTDPSVRITAKDALECEWMKKKLVKTIREDADFQFKNPIEFF